jgi:hypothetical protein
MNVQTMAMIDSTIFAGTQKGVFRSTDSGANWIKVGLDTSNIYQLATDGTSLFVYSNSGLYLSTTKGGSWNYIGTSDWANSYGYGRIYAVAVKGTNLFVGRSGGTFGGAVRVYRSTDFGATWTGWPNEGDFFNRGSVSPIITNGVDLFLAARSDVTFDIFRSTDDGATWLATPSSPKAEYSGGISNLAIDGTNLFACVTEGVNGPSLFQSTNNGVEWTKMSPGLPLSWFDIEYNNIAVSGPNVFLTTSEGAIGRSTDNGASWTNVSVGLDSSDIRDIAVSDKAAYVGTNGGGVYRYPLSTEGSLRITLYQEDPYGLLGPSGRVKLLRGTFIAEKQTNASSVVQFDGLIAGQYLYQVFNDRPSPWGEQWWGDKSVSVVAGTVTSDIHKHSTPFMSDARVYIDSTNELLSFGSRHNIPVGTKLRVEVDVTRPTYGQTGDLAASSRIILDRDMAQPYDFVSSSGPTLYGIGENKVTRHYPVVTENGSYYLVCAAGIAAGPITDAGGWLDPAFTVILPNIPTLVTPVNGASGQPTTGLTFQWRSTVGATAYRFQLAGDSIFTAGQMVKDTTCADTTKSVDGLLNGTRFFWRVAAQTGGSWGDYSAAWSFRTVQVQPARPELSYPVNNAALNSNVVAFVWHRATPEVTRYWHELSTDSAFFIRTTDSTIADTTYLRTGIPNGSYWWRVRAANTAGWGAYSEARKFSVTATGIQDMGGIPSAYSLGQNFPNPFNPLTVIRFGLPVQVHVRLTVHSLLGVEVQSLVDTQLPAGYHEVRFDASRLSSGVYFYRIQAGEFVQTKRLLLLR